MNAQPKDELSARLAHARHELRTPVNAILGYSEMLLEETEAGADPLFPQGLQQIQSLGQQILAAIQTHLGEASAADRHGLSLDFLASQVRQALWSPTQAVLRHCEQLLKETAAGNQEEAQSDLLRIQTAAQRLLTLLQNPFSTEPAPEPASSRTGEPPVPRTASQSVPQQTLGTGHVLIVDDNEMNRDMLARYLQRESLSYEMAHNGQQALTLLGKKPFDLVLLDIMMPEMDGFEVLSRLKKMPTLKHVPVIMISALDEIQSVVRCIEMGAEDYLPKPFDPVLLRARVGAGLEKKRLRDQELDYLHNVDQLTKAAAEMEAGRFEEHLLQSVADRKDALGQLARVFLSMAREVRLREQKLKLQVQQLRIEIDQTRKAQQVEEVTSSDYFEMLQQKARALKNRSPKAE
jgi:DNA-binding response OmpR family regulator